MQIDQRALEKILLNITEGHEMDLTGIDIRGIKAYLAKDPDTALPDFHAYVVVKKTPGDAYYLYPSFAPAHGTTVRIEGYKSVFHDTCALVRCAVNGNKVIYFDPAFDKDAYDSVTGSETASTVRLAAVSVVGALRDNPEESLENLFTEENLAQIEQNGVATLNPKPIIYGSIMRVINPLKKQANDAVMLVRNPLDGTPMELVTTIEDFREDDDSEKIGDYFYFIGSLH